MASGGAGTDVPRKASSRRFKQTGLGIGEIPFFLEVPAELDLDELADREKALEELERDMKP